MAQQCVIAEISDCVRPSCCYYHDDDHGADGDDDSDYDFDFDDCDDYNCYGDSFLMIFTTITCFLLL